jgi:hypothetical protein
MKNWFPATMVLAVAARLMAADEDWVSKELDAAAQQIEQRQFVLAHDVYRNLAFVHQAAPLNATAIQQVQNGIAATAGRLKADEARTTSAGFVERAKRLGYVQVGPAWMPPQAKERLSANAAVKLGKLAQAKACPACRGQGVSVCANCQSGIVRCMACNGTGRAGGSPITSRGAPCLICDGRGKTRCLLCKGTGFIVCPKCDGVGTVE